MISLDESKQLVKLMDRMNRHQIQATMNYLNEALKTAEVGVFF
jgi:hypothetical protein